MRLEEIEKAIVKIPKESIWDSFAHVITHTLVEGYVHNTHFLFYLLSTVLIRFIF